MTGYENWQTTVVECTHWLDVPGRRPCSTLPCTIVRGTPLAVSPDVLGRPPADTCKPTEDPKLTDPPLDTAFRRCGFAGCLLRLR